MSPTQRTLAEMRKRGYVCAVVEHWNQYARIRQDLFGFGDVLCISKTHTLLVQSTTTAHINERIEKIQAEPKALMWMSELCQPWRTILVHGWSKKGARGERKTWQLREVELVKRNGKIEPMTEAA